MEYEYEDWLVSHACALCSEYGSYYELFTYLYSRKFYPVMDRDSDRAEDGISLRMNFINEKGYFISPESFGICNILELIVALGIRCESFLEEHDEQIGRWIFRMIQNLGMDSMVDGHFNEQKACRIINNLINRRYDRNGHGGLFTITTRNTDMRKIEIWHQMCWYLDEVMDS